MPKRGQKRTPTSILKARGSWLARVREGEVEPALDDPDRPEFLSEHALAMYDSVAPELNQLGLLTVLDRGALLALCEKWGDYAEARENIREDGQWVVLDGVAGRIRNKWCAVEREAWQAYRQLAASFGLTPADRAGLKADRKPPAKKAGEMSDFEKHREHNRRAKG